jgi:5-methylcytosine-specific restriction endonuclease McrA
VSDVDHERWLQATAAEPFRCEPCERIFAGRQALLAHQHKHHDGPSPPANDHYLPWVCGTCQKAFHTLSKLQQHLRSDACEGEPLGEPKPLPNPVKCHGCKRTFLTQSGLAAHLRSGQSACAAQEPKTRSRALSSSLRDFARRHGWVCFWCGEPVRDDVDTSHPLGPTREHLVPASRGGSRRAENLRLAHKACNHRRGSLEAEEYLNLLQRKRKLQSEENPLSS